MPQKIKLLIGITGLILAVSSCGDSAIYDHSYSFKKHQWAQNEQPRFKVDVQDTTKKYNIDFTLRTTTDYPFSNFWMNVSIIFPDGTKLRKPYEVKITDQNGWLGEKSGTVVENHLSFPNTILPIKGKYQFVVEQATPETTVTEVLDVGLRIFEQEKKAQ